MGAQESRFPVQEGFVQLLEGDVPYNSPVYGQLIANCNMVHHEINVGGGDAKKKKGEITQVRDLKALRLNNMKNLLTKICEQMETSSTHRSKENDRLLSNCFKLLTRLMPVIFEHEHTQLTHAMLWTIEEKKQETTNQQQEQQQSDNVSSSSSQQQGAAASSSSSDGDDSCRGASQRPLGMRIVDAVVGAMFLNDFTLAPHQKSGIWEPGLGESESTPSGGSYDACRLDAVRCFLVLFSETLFRTPEEYKQNDNLFLRYATSLPPPLSSRLFFSLVNTCLSFDPVGWGVPYASLLYSEKRELLVDSSLQTLLVLMDYDRRDGGQNMLVTCLEEVKLAHHFSFLFSGFERLLSNPHKANATLLPSSLHQIGCFQELLILFWKMVDKNKSFLNYILKTFDMNLITVPMLYFMYEGRKDPSKIGLIHICTFILLLLSGERNFAVALNAPCSTRLPVGGLPSFEGNHADLLVIVITKVMTEGAEKLESLFDCFLTILSNISPYIKSFSMSAATKLLSLFAHFARPNVLAAHEHNHRFVVFFLEIFNNILQYQYEGNANMIYQILQRRDAFHRLSALGGGGDGNDVELNESAVAAASASHPPPPLSDVDSEAKKEGGGAEGGAAAAAGGGGEKKEPTVHVSGAVLPENHSFVVSQEWLRQWRDKLPLQPCIRLIQHLLPQVEAYCKSGSVVTDNAVVEFLKATTMVGLLPVPHPILIRKYQPNEYTNVWFTTYVWGIIFLRSQYPPLFDQGQIRLFTITFVDAT